MALQTTKELFLWLEKQFGDKEAVVDYPQGNRWNFKQLNDYSRRICQSYQKDGGLAPGDRVGWLTMSANTDVIALSFGARKMGVVPVIMNARASADRIAWMINRAGVKALAYSDDCAELVNKAREIGIPDVSQYIAIDEGLGISGEQRLDDIYRDNVDAPEPEFSSTADDLCVICFTSGSTGLPKPIMHTEESWGWNCLMWSQIMSVDYPSRVFVPMPPSFVGWAHMCCGSLRAAAAQVCSRFEPAQFLKICAEENISHCILTPTLIRMISAKNAQESDKYQIDTVRVAMITGEPVSESDIELGVSLFPNLQRVGSIGATEGIMMHTGIGNAYLQEHPNTVGQPLPGVTAELRDSDTGETILESGKTGVLYVTGPGISPGILDDAEATAEHFPDGWWRTGDLLYRDENGYYHFAGRNDNMFKSGNIKVHCEEVEATLKQHEAILDAIVVPVPDDKFGSVGYANIRSARKISAADIEDWWRREGHEGYMRPRHWKFWGEAPFPMVTAAKVNRKEIRDQAAKDIKQ